MRSLCGSLIRGDRMNSKVKHIILSSMVITVFTMFSQILYSQADRLKWQPPEKIMDAIGVKTGMKIGEAGVGRGYFTFPLASRVGTSGKIYANDISGYYLSILRDRAKKENLKQIKTILGNVTDPLFPEKNLDMIIMVYVLHCLEKPAAFTNSIPKYLKKNGLFVIIERNSTRDRGHYPSFMSNRQILEVIQKTSFTLVRKETFLPKDTIYIYKIRR